MTFWSRIKLLFGSEKCNVRGFHESASGNWQPAPQYGKDFFVLHCDGCSESLAASIPEPKQPISRIVLTRWRGDIYPAGMYEKSLTATEGKTVTCSSAKHVWTATKKRGKKAKRKRA